MWVSTKILVLEFAVNYFPSSFFYFLSVGSTRLFWVQGTETQYKLDYNKKGVIACLLLESPRLPGKDESCLCTSFHLYSVFLSGFILLLLTRQLEKKLLAFQLEHLHSISSGQRYTLSSILSSYARKNFEILLLQGRLDGLAWVGTHEGRELGRQSNTYCPPWTEHKILQRNKNNGLWELVERLTFQNRNSTSLNHFKSSSSKKNNILV